MSVELFTAIAEKSAELYDSTETTDITQLACEVSDFDPDERIDLSSSDDISSDVIFLNEITDEYDSDKRVDCFELDNENFSEIKGYDPDDRVKIDDDKQSMEKAEADQNENSPEKLRCRNEELEGQDHPETGVPFEKRTVEIDGEEYEVVAPKFDSMFDARLPDDKLQSSDREQFNECNKQLKDAIENGPDLHSKFTEEQIEQIKNGDTPDGYTWHHDTEKGKMQLVDTETHQKTGHTGGRSIWGGGSENR